MSIRQTARELRISRITVKKYYEMDDHAYIKYVMSHEYKDKRFDNYKEEIIELYQMNNNKVYKSSIYDVLEEKHGQLPGSERTFRNYVQYLEESGQLNNNISTRLYKSVDQLPFGKQLQLDFGELFIESGEKVYIFATVLSASRYRYVAIQNRPFRTKDVIHHLLDCFDHLEGVPKEIVIDQDKTLVVSENGGDIILTKQFETFKKEMGFSLYVCRKADPESKGKVENLVKFVKTSFFSGRVFNSFDEIQTKLDGWLVRRANGKICQSTGLIPNKFLAKEREKLLPIRLSIFRTERVLEREERRVSDKCLISVDASFYSVPKKYLARKVWIHKAEHELIIYESINGDEIARHSLSLIPGHQIIQTNHFRNFEGKPVEMKEKIISMNELPAWKLFIEKNYKRYNRYFRDQHSALQLYLKTNPDNAILEKALQFCLDNENYTAKNLEEAYYYMEGIETEHQLDILPALLTGIKAIKRESQDVKIANRKLSYYTSIFSLLGACL